MHIITNKMFKKEILNTKVTNKIPKKCLKDAVLFLFEKIQNTPISNKPPNSDIIPTIQYYPETSPLFGDHPDKTV